MVMLWLMEVGWRARTRVGHLAVGSFDGNATYDLEKRVWQEISCQQGEQKHNFISWQEAQNSCTDAISYWDNVFSEVAVRD